MSYVVFDLDQTLADVRTVSYFLVSFTLKSYIVENKPYLTDYFTDELDDQLARAYAIFVERIAREEQSAQPLGILRPGILEIMKQISTMESIVKGVAIYSNNQYLPNLRFVRDIIHHSIGKPIIGSCIHWGHPYRSNDRMSSMTKTWITLQAILIDQGAPHTLTGDRVFFFDDQNHPQLRVELHYYQVPEYYSDRTLDRIAAIYLTSLEEAKVNSYALYLHLTDVLDEETQCRDPSAFRTHDLIDLIYTATHLNVHPRAPLQDDRGIRIMKRALNDIRIQDRAIRGTTRRRTVKKSAPSR